VRPDPPTVILAPTPQPLHDRCVADRDPTAPGPADRDPVRSSSLLDHLRPSCRSTADQRHGYATSNATRVPRRPPTWLMRVSAAPPGRRRIGNAAANSVTTNDPSAARGGWCLRDGRPSHALLGGTLNRPGPSGRPPARPPAIPTDLRDHRITRHRGPAASLIRASPTRRPSPPPRPRSGHRPRVHPNTCRVRHGCRRWRSRAPRRRSDSAHVAHQPPRAASSCEAIINARSRPQERAGPRPGCGSGRRLTTHADTARPARRRHRHRRQLRSDSHTFTECGRPPTARGGAPTRAGGADRAAWALPHPQPSPPSFPQVRPVVAVAPHCAAPRPRR
jgi:hypothetical protein